MAMICLSLAGCSKDADINAFTAEFDATTKDMITKLDASPNAAGVADAQKAFDTHKPALKAKWDAIKDAMGFQVSADTKKKLEDGIKKNMTDLGTTIAKHSVTLSEDDAAEKAAMKLLDNFDFMAEQKK